MEPFVAEIRIFTGSFAPRGWALCNGQLLPISQNTALFSLLGTVYGGDGRSTFALPNLQERVPMHWGQGPGLSLREVGEQGGSATVHLTRNELPRHTHPASFSAAEGSSTAPASHLPGGALHDAYAAEGTRSSVSMNPQSMVSVGSGAPHPNMQPFLALNFIIALQGVYPPRN